MKRYVYVAVAILSLALIGCGEDATLPAGGTIYGDLLFTDGVPAAGVVVIVEATSLSAVSDDAGRFVIHDVLAVDRDGMGKYYTVRGFGTREQASVGFIVDHFKVKGQQSYSVGVVVVRETGSITGTILLEGQSDHSGVFVRVEGTSLETVTRADGSFALDRVPAHVGYSLPCTHDGYATMTISEVDNGESMDPLGVEPRATTDVGVATLHPQN